MNIRIGLLLIVFFTLISCNSNKEDRPIAKDDFVSLLIDLHLYDAISTDYSLKSKMVAIDSTTLYSSILLKHNTNKKEFETTLHWYTDHPKELSEIYNTVFGYLDKQNEKLKKETDSFNKSSNTEIWKETMYNQYIGDTIKYPTPFIIAIKDTGTYMISIKVRMLNDDKSKAPFLNIFFVKDSTDKIHNDRLIVAKTPLSKSGFMRDYQYVFKLEDSTYKYIKIILPDTPDRGKGKEKNLQISKIQILKKNMETDKTPQIKGKKK